MATASTNGLLQGFIRAGASSVEVSDLETYLELRRSELSLRTFEGCVSNFLRYCAPDFWRDPVKAHKRVTSEIKRRGLAPPSAAKVMGQIRDFLEYLRDLERLSGAQWASCRRLYVVRLRGRTSEAPTVYSFEELESMLNRARGWERRRSMARDEIYGLLLVHMHCGLRSCEGALLTWGEVDLDGIRLSLQDTPWRLLKTWRAARQIPMSGELFWTLSRLRPKRAKPDTLVFPGAAKWSKRKRIARGSKLSEAGLGAPTTLRHTFATALYGSELHRSRVLELMGHSGLNVTLRHYVGRDGGGIPLLDLDALK